MKKKICLVTNWYPSKDNPFQGVFFKEQAFAMECEYNFVIFRYQERITINPFKANEMYAYNKERNTIEYIAVAYMPIWIRLADVLYTFYKKMKRDTIEGVGMYISPLRKSWTQKKICSMFKLTNEEVDAFYCIEVQGNAFWIECLAERYKKPYIVGAHAPIPWPGTLISDVDKYAIEHANLFLAISYDKIRQILLHNIKLPRTVYIGNFVDETKFAYKKCNGDHIKTFITVGAYTFYKNYDMLIDVMNRLTEITKKDFRVMIVGYGANKGYAKNIEVLERKIRNSKFFNKVELIPEVPHKIICNVFNRADAFVMTSIQEGQPVAAIEAACCGLPIFATRCGGVEDYVEKNIGKIYGVTDVEGMADGLKRYLEGEYMFNPIEIRAHIIEKFGIETFQKNFIKAFCMVVNN